MITCDHCNKVFRYNCHLLRHLSSKTPCYTKTPSEYIDDTRFGNELNVVENQHNVDNKRQYYVKSSELIPNELREELCKPVEENQCKKCSKVLCNKYYLQKHEESCNGLNSLQCPRCTKWFSSSSSKSIHMKNVKCSPPHTSQRHNYQTMEEKKLISTPERVRITEEEFIRQATNVHEGKYGYDDVIYDGTKKKVDILCIKCNKIFQQIPRDHLKGNGCFTCGKERAGEIKKQKAADTFVSNAERVHGRGKYGYDDVIYDCGRKPVNIFCFKCNSLFSQSPASHLMGTGCPMCGIRERTEGRKKKAADTFVSKAEKVHGRGKYGYDDVIYNGYHKHVAIFCFKCNTLFSQSPASHLTGKGCPTCKNKTERIVCQKLDERLSSHGLKVTHMGGKVSKGIGRMDIVIEMDDDKRCFVEVDGFQHFKNVKKWKHNAIDVQKRDLDKHLRAIEKGHLVVRIDQEWVWNSHRNGKIEWIERLNETILKLASNNEPSIHEMFLSDKSCKYDEHLCYQYSKKMIKK